MPATKSEPTVCAKVAHKITTLKPNFIMPFFMKCAMFICELKYRISCTNKTHVQIIDGFRNRYCRRLHCLSARELRSLPIPGHVDQSSTSFPRRVLWGERTQKQGRFPTVRLSASFLCYLFYINSPPRMTPHIHRLA